MTTAKPEFLETTRAAAMNFFRQLATINDNDTTACPICLKNFAYDENVQEMTVELVHSYPGLFCICAAWSSKPMNESEQAQFRKSLTRNLLQCSWRDAEEHAEVIRDPDSETDDLLVIFHDALFILLHHALRRNRKWRFTKPQKSFTSSQTGWPRSLEELFPCGIQPSVAGYLFWAFEADGDQHRLSALVSIAMLARPVFMSTFRAEPELAKILVNIFIYHLDGRELAGKIESGVQSGDSSQEDDFSESEDEKYSSRPIGEMFRVNHPAWSRKACSRRNSACFLLNLFAKPAEGYPDDIEALFRGKEEQLLEVLLTGPITEFNRRTLVDVYTMLHFSLPQDKRKTLPAVVLETLEEVGLNPLTCSQPAMALLALRHQSVQRSCARCRKGALELPNMQPTRPCAGCNWSWYCSKECQRVDWKHGTPPHKMICGIIKQMGKEFHGVKEEDLQKKFGDFNDYGAAKKAVYEWVRKHGLLPKMFHARWDEMDSADA